MKYKKLLSLGLAVLLGVTMPTAVYASEDIVVATEPCILEEDVSAETEVNDEEVAQQEMLNEDDEEDWTIEDNSDETDSENEVDADFTSEEITTEAAGEEEEVVPVISLFKNTSVVASGTSKTGIFRGSDAKITLRAVCGAKVDGKIIDIRSYDNLSVYADIYIDDTKINDTPIEVEKNNKSQVKTTYTLTDEVMQKYPDGKKVTVKMYSNLATPASAVLTQSFNLLAPIESNPSVESFRIDGDMLEFIRGEGISSYLRVVLSGPIQENKAPYYAIYIDDKKATESLPLTRNQFNENNYDKKITISPEMTEYLPEGTKFEIKVGFGPEMEDISDKVLTFKITGKPFIPGAKVDTLSIYRDETHKKKLITYRPGRTYTAYVVGTLRDVIDSEPLEIYAEARINDETIGEREKLAVESDNSGYSGALTFSLPAAVSKDSLISINIGFGKDMDNETSWGTSIKEKFDYQEIKVNKIEILDTYQEEEVKQIDRNAPQGFIVNLKLEGIPDDFHDMHSEVWLGDQLLKEHIGSTAGFRVDFNEEEMEKIKDYEGSFLSVKLVNDEDDETFFSYDMPLVGLTTKEEETASTVANQLKNLPAVDKIALEDKESVKAARDAYDALNEDQKKLVPEEQVKALTEAEAKIAELQKAADKKAADEKAAKVVTDKIASLPAVKNLKLTDASKVKAARDAYNKLSADQKKLVTAAQLKALTDAEARIAQLQKAAQVKPKITLNVTSLPIQVKKSTAGIRIKTTAIKGDKIKSAKSSKSKVVKVSVKNGKLTVKGLKAGKATVTVTSTKGAKATVKIKVQKQKVATKKLKATVSTKQILKKGKKVKLKVAKTPFTAQDTVKWTSSNKKIATVTSKGVVKGLKKGTATITAKAGKKVVKFKVRVK